MAATPPPAAAGSATPASVAVEPSADGTTLRVRLGGTWTLGAETPSARGALERALEGAPAARRLAFDAADLAGWDTRFMVALLQVVERAAEAELEVDRDGLPEGARRLLALTEAVPEQSEARRRDARLGFLARIGVGTRGVAAGGRDLVEFVGLATTALVRFATFRGRYRRSDLWLIVQDAGAQALPIVTMIAFVVGAILAFVGSVQLRQFGAEIYVANLVTIGMAREMAGMMTAIVMAGRTGAAYAAQLGTMKVTEELDALTTMGLPPIDYLVVPRMVALGVMMPLLTIYANFVGMLGGAVVAIGMLDLTPALYYNQSLKFVSLTAFGTGLAKSFVFGLLVALSGCLRGMQSGSSASAVGDAATSAVVTAIVLIVVADGIFAVLFHVLGI